MHIIISPRGYGKIKHYEYLLKRKDKEIERLKEYQESYRKELDYWRIQYSYLKERMQEVRKYANKYNDKIQKDILEILDKENKDE